MTVRRFARDTSGAAAVEFALVALPFVVMVIGMIEFGRALYIKNSLSNAADWAQRAVIIDQNATSSTLTSVAQAAFKGGDASELAVEVASVSSDGDTYRSITLSYTMTLVIPLVSNGEIVLTTNRRVAIDD